MFTLLVLSNLALIHANRSWERAIWRRPATPNRAFVWITAATLALLGCVLGIPEVRQLFAFTQPTPAMLLAGAGIAVVSLLWFQGVKWGFSRWPADRRPTDRAG
jgi:Ca2+-transporting ATPase